MSSYARKRSLYVECVMADKIAVPKCWLPDLIHSQMANGSFERIYTAAICWARHKNDQDSVQKFTILHGQVIDYYADMDEE